MNKKSDIPLYKQVKNNIIKKIESEEFSVEERIPGENKLINIYDVSLITVRKAISELVNEGYLYRIQGRGTYVANRMMNRPLNVMSFTESMREKNFNVTTKLLELDLIKDEFVADKLNISAVSEIIKIKRLRYVDQEAIALQTSYIPHEILPYKKANELKKEGSLYKILKGLGTVPARAHEIYKAKIIKDKEVSKLLNKGIGSPIFSAERITYTVYNKIFEYAKFILSGDKYTVEMELRK
ncbi:GntR family transcriptional regulator [Halocella sp. SP3-1]|uniref:GntR family transcriptional regulator n=1 Tax=Halocella sp. SP3-1 TaxID=2382161 RepID=UPI000F74FC40|nr:GntR family transcriptional regulator [Halocella sp. SP3-1]AZO93658.1 GntR family transcriptional regulator [Halocella sp. SP3-1]